MHSILWDLDGTIADSEPAHAAALVASLAKFGIKASKDDELIGLSRQDVYKSLCEKYTGVPDYQAYDEAANHHFGLLSDQIVGISASIAAMQRYAAEGRKQVIVSNSVTYCVEVTVAALGISGIISGYISNDGKGKPKPDPEPYLRGLELLECDPKQAIAVEDTNVGTTAALGAGLFVVGVGHEAAQTGASVIYPAFPELTPEQIITDSEVD